MNWTTLNFDFYTEIAAMFSQFLGVGLALLGLIIAIDKIHTFFKGMGVW